MWSNLFSAVAVPPSYPALVRVAALCAEGYRQGPESIPVSAGKPVSIHTPGHPFAWTWTEGDYQVVLINGSTSPPDEYSRQWSGWLLPEPPFADAYRNSFYSAVALMMFGKLRPAKTFVCGHSMGGAVAHELGRLINSQWPDPDYAVVSLGNPGSVAESAMVEFPPAKHISIRYHADPVPLLPGDIALNVGGYRQPGRSYTLAGNGSLSAPYVAQPGGAIDAATYLSLFGIDGHSSVTYYSRLAIWVAPKHNPVITTLYVDP